MAKGDFSAGRLMSALLFPLSGRFEKREPVQNAAEVLDALASGRPLDKAVLLSAALALDTLTLEGVADWDLLDAAAALKIIATGGVLELDDAGRSVGAIARRAVEQTSIRCQVLLITSGQPNAPLAVVSRVVVVPFSEAKFWMQSNARPTSPRALIGLRT
jgi:hypothetical protein